MVIDTVSLRGRLVSAGRAGRGAVRHLLRMPLAGLQNKGLEIEKLLLRPRDLRTADPSFATEIYHGHFGLAGAVAMTGSESPFEIVPPSRAWEAELHGFGWLRHLSAAGDEISREHARALIADWMRHCSRPRGVAWLPGITGRRIISWLSHSGIFLEGAEQRLYDAVTESLTRQVRHLYASYRDAQDGIPRLVALAALVFAELCTSETVSNASRASRLFTEELDRQILSDGGHISRNPAALVEILLDLLPLRQCFIARDHPPPERLVSAVDRMMPMIRFFRLGDGSLARFNGSGATATDNLAAVLAHDDTRGQPLTHSVRSGYCRLDRNGTIVVIDCGRPPPLAISGAAHAGCLSLEMSAGACPIIVNCGAPARRDADWRLAARATAAHSTLVMSDTSSSQLLDGGPDENGEEMTLLGGPANVTAALETTDGALIMRASHDGYDQRFGVTHARRISVSVTGETVLGEDMLIAPHGLKGEAREGAGAFAIRFHLHPSVEATLSEHRRTVHFVLPDEARWQLTSREQPLTMEESVYLADMRGPRRARQIVLYGTFDKGTELRVNWVLEKSAERESAPSEAGAGEAEPAKE
jgi:uncharacterized heparinase superfamily protein